MVDKRLQIAVILSLCPLLGSCCSCAGVSSRSESLKNGVCYGDVYSAVVVEVSCNCLFDNQYDCRTYEAMSSESYSAEISTRLNCSHKQIIPREILRTCTDLETAIAPGTTFDTGDPQEIIYDTTDPCEPPCPFNNPNSTEYPDHVNPCMYQVRVTEVFTGNYSVGDIVETVGPDVLTSCSFGQNRVLMLNEEYLAGVGGGCTVIKDWESISEYRENELETLRQLSKDKDDLECGSTALRAALLTVTVLLALSFVEL